MELLSQMWSLLGLLTVLQNILPSQLLSLLHSIWQSMQDSLTPYSYFDVPEFLSSSSVDPNHLYRHVSLYLHHLLNSPTSPPPPRLTLSLSSSSPAHTCLSLSPNHSVLDLFSGHRLLWTHNSETLNDSLEERRSFSLRLPKRNASSILKPYLRHVTSKALSFHAASRDRRLHTNASPRAWSSVPFCHPATFSTLALSPDLKSFLLNDLSSFADGLEFYHNVGRAWKRGYLLHGPPGSGKSSLIAAIANYLNYDVYDLELTRVENNSDLRSLLIQTTNRSVIVIEDIDCSLGVAGSRNPRKKRRVHDDDNDEDTKKVTLSGLLNFTDGLWSCCGEEKVIIFTTNYKEGVDEALLRAGRMDVHVRLGECGAHAVREMVGRYVGPEAAEEEGSVIERCIGAGAVIMPAEVGEVLMRNRGDGKAAVRELVTELRSRVESGGSEEEEEEVSSAKGKRKGRGRWEGKVRVLGRLRSLTKSDSGRRGV